jgi:transposase
VSDALPSDPAELCEMIAALRVENARMTQENARLAATLRAHDLLVEALRARIAKLQRQRFGPSSEKIEREIEQLELALEDLRVAAAEGDAIEPEDPDADASVSADTEVEADEPAEAPKPRRRPAWPKARPASGASSAPARPARTAAATCGSRRRRALGATGEDVSEPARADRGGAQGHRDRPAQSVVPPMRAHGTGRAIVRHRSEGDGERPEPAHSPRAMAGPGLLAHVLVSKLEDHVPLYRQAEVFARMGADIPDTTLVGG